MPFQDASSGGGPQCQVGSVLWRLYDDGGITYRGLHLYARMTGVETSSGSSVCIGARVGMPRVSCSTPALAGCQGKGMHAAHASLASGSPLATHTRTHKHSLATG